VSGVHARILGTGRGVPPKVLTNNDLSRMMDTSDEWIVTRTGIRERHILAPELAASDLATEAARAACEKAGVPPSEVDCIIVGTVTGDCPFPSTAAFVQHKLGAKPGGCAFDLSAACAGFLYGLALGAADVIYILSKGQVVWQGTASELAGAAAVRETHLGV